ncbi:MAG TPA: tetratricopeptide repeat protein [Kofleriaceae bacterium]
MRRLLAVVAVLGVAGPAAADPIEDLFNDAANRIAEEKYEEAVRQLEALAGEAPDHRLAPEALFTAAEIREEHLNDPAAALALYRKIEATYPDSRPALASARRAQAIRKQIGEQQEGLAPQRRFTEIREGFPDRPEEQSIAMTEQLLRDFPDWVGAPSVAMWLAEVDLRAGRIDSAMRRYAAAADRYPASDARFDALLGATEAALQIGRTDEAQHFIDMMDTAGDPGRQALRRDALRQLGRVQGRSRLVLVAALVAAGCFLLLAGSLWRATGSPARAARALWPPPVEILYLAPVAVFLAAAAFTGYEGLGPSVTAICAAGMAAAWLSGAGLAVRRATPGPRRVAAVVVHSLAACAIVLAVAYWALLRFELLDPVLDTLRNGPDR